MTHIFTTSILAAHKTITGRTPSATGSAATTKGLIFAALAVACSNSAFANAPPAKIPNPLSLEWCLERARDASPALERADAEASIASHRARSSGTLDDPRFSYEASNIPIGDFDFKSTPLSGHQLALRQKIPFPTLLSSHRDAAEHGARSSLLLVEDQRFVTEGAVESAWAELAFAQQALVITTRNISLLRQLAATTESRYRVGTGLQQDILRAQVELTELLQERLRREEAIEIAGARLAELLDLPAGSTLPRTTELRVETTPPHLESLIESIEQRSPRLRAARTRIEQARVSVRAAELEGLPDVDLGVGYRIRENVAGDTVEGDDFFSAGFTVRLPVNRSKWKSIAAEKKAELRKANADLRASHAALVAHARRAHAEIVRASSEEALLETGLVPQALQSLESTRSAYEVGRIQFLSLLDSQVTLLNAELRLARARADKRLAFSALEATTGEKLR